MIFNKMIVNQIVPPYTGDYMWINGIIRDGLYGWNAEAFRRPSVFGMDENDRVSSVYVSRWNESKGCWDEDCYVYERGEWHPEIEEDIKRDVLSAIVIEYDIRMDEIDAIG